MSYRGGAGVDGSSDPHAGGRLLQGGAPLGKGSGVVILLHGRGASAEDILPLGAALTGVDWTWIAPEAVGHTWYPQSFLAPLEENQPWLGSALRRIEQVVQHAIEAGVEEERIVLSGFSQGACLTCAFVAASPRRYRGFAAFTGGLPGADAAELSSGVLSGGDLRGTPGFLGSGDPDAHVPWSRVEESAKLLLGMGAEVTIRRYPGMPHTISQQEIAEARAALRL